MPYTLEYLLSTEISRRTCKQYEVAYLIGGAHDAMITFLAPTSFAIWIISLEVVPRTIESVAAPSIFIL